MNFLGVVGGLMLGVLIGGVSGVVGIGGGALLVPALVFLYGMSQIRAQGTSLATLLLPIGFFAFWTYYKAGHVDIKLAVLVSIGFAAGAWAGGLWAQRLPELVLRRGFAALLVVLALRLAFSK
jgi:uncharacterized membrane protein YfcA